MSKLLLTVYKHGKENHILCVSVTGEKFVSHVRVLLKDTLYERTKETTTKNHHNDKSLYMLCVCVRNFYLG